MILTLSPMQQVHGKKEWLLIMMLHLTVFDLNDKHGYYKFQQVGIFSVALV